MPKKIRTERFTVKSSDVVFLNKPKKRVVKKRDFSSAQREKLASNKKALPDGSFPIASVQDLKNAIQAIGRAKNPDRAKRWIKRRARALNAENLIPEGW